MTKWFDGGQHDTILMANETLEFYDRDPAAKWTILSVVIIIFLASAMMVPLLYLPFERDEGEYTYIAWRVGHHELPYRDWIDQKRPASFDIPAGPEFAA